MDASASRVAQSHAQSLTESPEGGEAVPGRLFENPFHIEDLLVFDDVALRRMLRSGGFGLTVENLGRSLQGAPEELVERIKSNLPPEQRLRFIEESQHPVPGDEVEAARRRILDGLFWELIYWKMPELYDELTEGEQLHPGIFQRLEPELRDKVVVDVGAGTGRASFECLRYGARLVYAVEPSPGLLHILKQKLMHQPDGRRIVPMRGSFEELPLEDASVDVALSCSAFTAEPEQGGEPGLAEMKRVTKPGGKIVLIWPRIPDYGWLAAHGFHYVALPLEHEMCIRFRSLESALRCTRLFYAQNEAAIQYILKRQQPEVPFSVLGVNPPRDYCWLAVE